MARYNPELRGMTSGLFPKSVYNNPTSGMDGNLRPLPPGAHVAADLIFPRPPKEAVEVVRSAGGPGQDPSHPTVNVLRPRSKAKQAHDIRQTGVQLAKVSKFTEIGFSWLCTSFTQKPVGLWLTDITCPPS